jgi:glycosyltransferase involved in cell wall biosynthesis
MKSNEIKSSVSVIIPAHNAAQYIEQAIESVLNQTLRPIEVIVVNDGSTDETARIVEKFPEPVQLLTQNKSGVSAARNCGIRRAQGKFIAFLDADDVFIRKNKLEKQIKIARERNCDLVISGWRITDENLCKIKDRKAWLEAPRLNLFNWIRSVPVLPSALLVEREKLLEVNGFDETLTNAEDVDLIFRLALAGCRAEWLREITVAYRQHAGNATNQVRRQNKGFQTVLDKLFRHPGLPVSIRRIESEIRCHSLIWAAYDCFLVDDLAEMKAYLIESIKFAEFEKFGLLMNWFYSFERFSTLEEKINLNSEKLLNSDEWRDLENLLSN